MPFEPHGLEPFDAIIHVCLTQAEKAHLRDDADLAGFSLSELVHRRYFGRPIVANTDAVMIKELRRLDGLLKFIRQGLGRASIRGSANGLSQVSQPHT